MSAPPPRSDNEEQPPLFRSWRSFYLVLVAELLVLIALFVLLGWWAA